MTPFIVYALPRSRTAWLAQFLSYANWICHHEIAIQMREVIEIPALFNFASNQGHVGTVETAAAQGWFLIEHLVPGIRSIVIRRPVDQVIRSMMAVDLRGVATYDEGILRRTMLYGERMLAQISARPGVLTVDYDDLETEDGCARVFEHALPYQFDKSWWNDLRRTHIEVDVAQIISYYHQNRLAVDRFKSACRSEVWRLARAGVLRKALLREEIARG